MQWLICQLLFYQAGWCCGNAVGWYPGSTQLRSWPIRQLLFYQAEWCCSNAVGCYPGSTQLKPWLICQLLFYQAGWCCGNAVGWYLGSTQLKSRQRQQLSRLKFIVVVLSPVKGQDSTQATSFHILCNYHSTVIVWCCKLHMLTVLYNKLQNTQSICMPVLYISAPRPLLHSKVVWTL